MRPLRSLTFPLTSVRTEFCQRCTIYWEPIHNMFWGIKQLLLALLPYRIRNVAFLQFEESSLRIFWAKQYNASKSIDIYDSKAVSRIYYFKSSLFFNYLIFLLFGLFFLIHLYDYTVLVIYIWYIIFWHTVMTVLIFV